MGAERAVDDLRKGLGETGFRMSMVPLDRLADLRAYFAGLLKEGMLERAFHDGQLAGFDWRPPEDFGKARSVIIAAARQPKVRVRFNYSGRVHSHVIPPTYDYSTDEKVAEVIDRVLEAYPFETRAARLPWKSLAVRSGLALYGRNNITYLEGWGSYVRLTGFYSDIPCTEDTWQEAAAMKACEHCMACLEACPSGAMTGVRFLLRAERCITLYNEEAPNFPAWIEPSWHNSLVGCMLCQDVCPANRANVGWLVGDVEFSEEETGLLLEGRPPESLPEEVVKKLEAAELLAGCETLPRNLRVLLAAA